MFLEQTTHEDVEYWLDRLNENQARLDIVEKEREQSETAHKEMNLGRWLGELYREREIYEEFLARDQHKMLNPPKFPLSMLYKKEV